MEIQTIIISVLAILAILLLILLVKTRYRSKKELQNSLDSDVLIIKHVKLPSENTVMFQNKIVSCEKHLGNRNNFFLKEIYWLLSPDGELIENTRNKTSISSENCVFALTPCSVGDTLIRGTRINSKQCVYSAYKLLCITEKELVFVKTELESKNLFITKYLLHKNKKEPMPFPESIEKHIKI